MNILNIVPSFFPAWRYGGSIESVYRLCQGVAKTGCKVRVLTTDGNGLGEVLDVETDEEVKVGEHLSVRYCPRLMQDSVSPTLLKLLPSYVHWADVVHLTGVYSFPTLPTLFHTKRFKKPLVWSARGSFQRWPGSSKPLLKTLWEEICYFLAPKQLILHMTSEEEARESQNRLPGTKTVVISNGVELPDQVNHVAGNGTLRLGYLGRIDPKKGIENLLTACERLKVKTEIPFILTMGGAGNLQYTRTIITEIENLRLTNHVKMVGYIETLRKGQFFENIDILVLPSYTENFGLVVAEALAHAVPVLVSKGTPWSRVEKVGCGLWVDNDADSLARAITQMIKMPLVQMGRQGRQWMEQEFSWSRVAEKMTELYQHVMAETQ